MDCSTILLYDNKANLLSLWAKKSEWAAVKFLKCRENDLCYSGWERTKAKDEIGRRLTNNPSYWDAYSNWWGSIANELLRGGPTEAY